MEIDNEKEEERVNGGFPSIISMVISLFALFIIYFFFHRTGQTGSVIYAIVGVIVVTLGVIVYPNISSLVLPTDERIIHGLEKEGYECGKKEGAIYFKKNDCKWWIYTANISKRYRKVVFELAFKVDYLDKNQAEANRMVCIIGHRNRAVSTAWDGEDAVSFAYFTVLTSAKDIMREFASATSAINTAASEFFALKEKVFDDNILKEEHKIGFQSQMGKVIE